MQKVVENVLKKISPSAQERKRTKKIIDSFVKKLQKIKIPGTKVIPGGSLAKDTWLAGGHDADVFFAFDYSTYKEDGNLSDKLEKHLKKIFKNYTRLHGSRNYFQIQEPEFVFEIIPILNITKASQARNITDVSILHTKWVLKNSKKALRDQIRLSKAFCKANKLYGAESYIRGFSGYVLELLTVHYGGFRKLLQGSQKWKHKQVIDPGKHYKNALEASHSINLSKHAPLIVVDPVDATRNAAAALNEEKFDMFKKKAQAFLKKPASSFFQTKEVTVESLQKTYKGKKMLIVEVKPLKGKRDVVGSKLLKIFNYLSEGLKEFGVQHKDWQWEEGQKALLWWVVKKKEIAPVEVRQGPPLSLTPNVQDFKKKNKDTFEKKGVLYANVKRKHTTPDKLIKFLIKKEYVQERVNRLDLL